MKTLSWNLLKQDQIQYRRSCSLRLHRRAGVSSQTGVIQEDSETQWHTITQLQFQPLRGTISRHNWGTISPYNSAFPHKGTMAPPIACEYYAFYGICYGNSDYGIPIMRIAFVCYVNVWRNLIAFVAYGFIFHEITNFSKTCHVLFNFLFRFFFVQVLLTWYSYCVLSSYLSYI